MNERERLIKLIGIGEKKFLSSDEKYIENFLADHLLANGVIVPPCKVGDVVYDIFDGTAYATRVLHFVYFGDRWACRTVSSFPNVEEFGKTVFLTRAEAEKALAERGKQ